jgi:hypothetical protein
MYSGIISQLYKGQNDKSDLSNWRPLTMLNVDYKILSKILVNRLKIIMPHIVHKDQTCSILGRDIRDGICFLYNAIYYAKDQDLTAVLLSVDHMRAFDIVEWNFVLKVLEYFKLGNVFIKWISMIYKNGKIKSAVQVNGHLSSFFNVSRGLRQGCPLSALLYVLVSEIITNYIRKLPSVRGLHLLGTEHKICNYADDTNFLVTDFKSVQQIFNIYKTFKSASGATLKEEKTKILLFGSTFINSVPKCYQKYIVPVIKIYGVYFNRFGTDTQENIKKIMDSFDKLQSRQAHHELSYIARVRIIETYYLSALWYVCPYIELSKQVIEKIEDCSSNFIWYPKSGRNPVKNSTLKLDFNKGGINMIDLKSKQIAFLIMLLKKMKISDPKGKDIFWHYYENARSCVTKLSLKQANVPYLYKMLRSAEMRSRLVITDNHFLIKHQNFDFAKITTKLVYNIFKTLDFDKICDLKYWTDNLKTPVNKFVPLLKLINSKFIPGSVKNTHFSIIHRFLHTNSRANHMLNADPNCKYCFLAGNQHRENIKHCIIDCPRLTPFWAEFSALVNRLDNNITLDDVDKIFGRLHNDRTMETVLNLLIQIAQKTIWQTRWKLESKNKHVDVWSHFKKHYLFVLMNLKKILNRQIFDLHFVKHRIVKISRYKLELDF